MSEGALTYYVGFVHGELPARGQPPAHHADGAPATGGCKAIAVVGGGTGMVGDPSGKTEARQLDAAAIQSNLEQRAQIGRSRWMAMRARSSTTPSGCSSSTTSSSCVTSGSALGRRMLSAEGYKQRMERGLSFIEFNYQLLQAYDFLVLCQQRDVVCRSVAMTSGATSSQVSTSSDAR